VVVGIVAILLLAVVMDALLVILERVLTPWTRAGSIKSVAHARSGAEFIADAKVHSGAGS
jgi:osmoprotectant transport system permease protein